MPHMCTPSPLQHRAREARVVEEARALAAALEHAGHGQDYLVGGWEGPTVLDSSAELCLPGL